MFHLFHHIFDSSRLDCWSFGIPSAKTLSRLCTTEDLLNYGPREPGWYKVTPWLSLGHQDFLHQRLEHATEISGESKVHSTIVA